MHVQIQISQMELRHKAFYPGGVQSVELGIGKARGKVYLCHGLLSTAQKHDGHRQGKSYRKL